MKKFPFFPVLFLSLTFTAGCAKKTTVPTETTSLNNHFEFILYDGLKDTIIQPIFKKLEDNYARILTDLEVVQISKVKVKVWGNEQKYLDDMQNDIGQRFPGTTGYVYSPSELRILYTSNAPQTAHHEFAHVVSINLKDNFGNNPRWLWEAVAIYESGELKDPRNISYIVSGNYPTLAELNSDPNSSRKIYDVGYTISDYIMTTWGKEKFIALIKNNGNIQSVLNMSESDFETGWQNFVKNKYF